MLCSMLCLLCNMQLMLTPVSAPGLLFSFLTPGSCLSCLLSTGGWQRPPLSCSMPRPGYTASTTWPRQSRCGVFACVTKLQTACVVPLCVGENELCMPTEVMDYAPVIVPSPLPSCLPSCDYSASLPFPPLSSSLLFPSPPPLPLPSPPLT